MTDNEIISIDDAIRHCYETYYERDDLCRKCRDEHKQLAKWLEELKENRNIINRQKAEILELQKRIINWRADMDYRPDKIKSEAIKEFAEELEYFVLHEDIEVVDPKFKDYESYINGANQFRHQIKNGINNIAQEITD